MDEPATHSSLRGIAHDLAIDHLVLPGALLVQIVFQESGDLVMRGLDAWDRLWNKALRGPASERPTNL